jgi:hypothetical protein
MRRATAMSLVILGGGLTMVGAELSANRPACHPAKDDSPYDTQPHCGSGFSGGHGGGWGSRGGRSSGGWLSGGIARGGFGASGHGAGAGD